MTRGLALRLLRCRAICVFQDEGVASGGGHRGNCGCGRKTCSDHFFGLWDGFELVPLSMTALRGSDPREKCLLVLAIAGLHRCAGALQPLCALPVVDDLVRCGHSSDFLRVALEGPIDLIRIDVAGRDQIRARIWQIPYGTASGWKWLAVPTVSHPAWISGLCSLSI